MPFSTEVKKEALVRSRRACCLCREFAGRDINVHHIIPESEGGSNDIDNAIVLCLKCHSQVGHYNPRHPIGNKYTPDELYRHRDEFWELCRLSPHIPLPRAPISVRPGRIHLSPRGWRKIDPIKIHNASREIYYQIWIRFVLDTLGISWDDINIEWVNREIVFYARLGHVTVSGDTFQILATDKQGIKSIYLWLESLNPAETRTFRMTSKVPPPPEAATNGRILVELWGFETEPTSMLEAENRVALKFNAPEDISIHTLGILMRREY